MRISKAHIKSLLPPKKKSGSSKLSGTVVKNFSAEGKVAVLLGDGTTQLIKMDTLAQSGETIYFDELDILQEKLQQKQDSTDLQQHKPLKNSELVALLSNTKSADTLPVGLKELANLIKDGALSPKIAHKVKELIEQFKSGVALFSTSGSDDGKKSDEALKSLLAPMKASQEESALPPKLAKMVESVRKELLTNLVSFVKEGVVENSSTKEIAQSVLRSISSQVVQQVVSDDKQSDTLLQKIPLSEITSKHIPQVLKEQPLLQPLVSLVQQKPELLTDLFVVQTSNLDLNPQEQSDPATSVVLPKVLPFEESFMSVFTAVKASFPNVTDLLSPTVITEILLESPAVQKDVLPMIEAALGELLSEQPESKKELAQAVKPVLSFLSKLEQSPSKEVVKALLQFHQSGGKEVLTPLKSMTQTLGSFQAALPNELQNSPVLTPLQGLLSQFQEIETLFQAPGLSSEMKQKGLEELLSKLGVLPNRTGGATIKSVPLLTQELQTVLSKVEEHSALEKLPKEEQAELKKILSTLRKESGDLLKNISLISLQSKPLEQQGVVEQTFYMPVQVGGEEVSVRLTVKRDKKSKKGGGGTIDGTQVEIAMELKKLGKVESRLQLTKTKQLSVALKSGRDDVVQWFRNNLRQMYSSLESSELKSISLIIDGVKPFQERTAPRRKSRIEYTG